MEAELYIQFSRFKISTENTEDLNGNYSGLFLHSIQVIIYNIARDLWIRLLILICLDFTVHFISPATKKGFFKVFNHLLFDGTVNFRDAWAFDDLTWEGLLFYN